MLGLVAVILIVPAAVHRLPGTSDEVHYTFTGPTSVAFDWRGTGNRHQIRAHDQLRNHGGVARSEPDALLLGRPVPGGQT